MEPGKCAHSADFVSRAVVFGLKRLAGDELAGFSNFRSSYLFDLVGISSNTRYNVM